MTRFVIQDSHRDSKEIKALVAAKLYFPKQYEILLASHMNTPGLEPDEVPVGSVEFCEKFLGKSVESHCYPVFLRGLLYRKIWLADRLEDETFFIKPADQMKRFEAGLFNLNSEDAPTGPFWMSEIVEFVEEWRYYVAQGKVLEAHWYQGREEEVDPPKFPVEIPPTFHGAVDLGRLNNGKIALVENNWPFACGWYGNFSEKQVDNFAKWVILGWEYTQKNTN